MPLTKKGKKIMHAMEEEYGKDKGEGIFYASKNKGTIKGVEDKKHKSKALKKAMHSYSAKRAHKGKDLGKPGKNFKKIEDKAEKEYGSKEAGKRVAGAVLARLRAK